MMGTYNPKWTNEIKIRAINRNIYDMAGLLRKITNKYPVNAGFNRRRSMVTLSDYSGHPLQTILLDNNKISYVEFTVSDGSVETADFHIFSVPDPGDHPEVIDKIRSYIMEY